MCLTKGQWAHMKMTRSALFAAEVVAVDGRAGDDIGEREVGGVVPSASMVDAVCAMQLAPFK